MHASFKNILLVAVISCIAVSSAWAEQLGENWEITFSERFRLVTWDNTITLDETSGSSRTFTRHRTQLGGAWSPAPTALVRLQLANEFRYHVAPATIDFDLDELFVDQLFVKVTHPWRWPVSLTLGRQNIMLGEGFIVMDGHPLDGSRSIYFNALRFDIILRPNHTLTAFASYQKETDTWLPIIHEQDQPLVEQPETGIGLYYAGIWSGRDIHGYLIHKRRDDNDHIPYTANSTAIGGRIKLPLLRDLAAVVEAGYQFGGQGDNDRRAVGGHGYIEYRPQWNPPRFFLPVSLRTGMIYLSGDNPDTDDREDWDPMFARWPKWSESYIYTQIQEDGVAWWTNLFSAHAAARFDVSPRVDLRLDYHHLMAPRKPSAESEFPGGDGTSRGDLFIGKLSFAFDTHWSGHLLWEGFVPGNYYTDGADSYAWIRAELMFRY